MAAQPRHDHHHICWATNRQGKPCGKPSCKSAEASGIPYCSRHLRVGDEAFFPVDHDERPDIFGKILVCRFPIPKNYKLIYWGNLCRDHEVPKSAEDHTIQFCPNVYSDMSRGTIDPTPYKGSVAQFAATVGPGELITMTPEYRHFGDYGKNRTARAGRVYRFTRDVPAGHQVTHDYGSGWMDDRDIKTLCAGTAKYPILRRKSRKKKDKPAAKGKGSSKGKQHPRSTTPTTDSEANGARKRKVAAAAAAVAAATRKKRSGATVQKKTAKRRRTGAKSKGPP